MSYVELPHRKAEVVKDVDVIVVGGGTAGVVAALASARTGASTVLIERYACVGGMSTGGMINFYHSFHNVKGERVIGGIAREIVDRLEKMGGTPGSSSDYTGLGGSLCIFNSKILELLLFEMLEESGVYLQLHSYVFDVLLEGNRLKGVILANKSGIQAIQGKVFVDSTGDGDLAALAGAPYEKANRVLVQPVTLEFRVGGVSMGKVIEYIEKHPGQFELIVSPDKVRRQRYLVHWLAFFPPLKEATERGELPPDLTYKQIWFNSHESDKSRGIVTFNATRVEEIDGVDVKDLTCAEIKARKQIIPLIDFFKKNFPGFENAYLLDIASQMGVRETRRIMGNYVITKEDVLEGRRKKDVVARAISEIDIHETSSENNEFVLMKPKGGKTSDFDIPYGSLVSQNVDGLLVAGRCISATREANGAIRFMVVCMATGQAAGTAAALAARNGATPPKLNIGELQDVLRAQGVLI